MEKVWNSMHLLLCSFLLCLILKSSLGSVQHYALTCPDGWVFGFGYCFKYFHALHTYDDAQEICSNYGDGHIAIAKDFHEKASFVRHLVQNSYPRSQMWWQGACVPANQDPLTSVYLSNGGTLNYRVGFLENCEIDPAPKPYRRCQAMKQNHNSYLDPVVYGSTFRPHNEKLPFVCVQHICPAGTYPSDGVGMLKCANGRCVPRMLECNRIDDCGDYTDEKDCPHLNNFVYYGTTGVFNLASYDSYSRYQWYIEVPPGYHIIANITNLKLEKDTDVLYIYIGGRSQELSHRTWSYSGDIPYTGPLYCPSTFMTFVFSSDHSVNQEGFHASWSAVPAPALDIREAAVGSIGSIVYNPLPRGARREWQIKTDRKWLIVTLIMKRLVLPPGSWLSVYDGKSYEDTLLFTYRHGEENKQSWLTAHYIQSTGQYMSLLLYTPVTSHSGEMDFIYYSGCDVNLATPRLIMLSPGHGLNPYPNNIHCTYIITTDSLLLEGVRGANENLEVVVRYADLDALDLDELKIFKLTDNGYSPLWESSAPTLGLEQRFAPESTTIKVEFKTSGLRASNRGWSVGLSTGCEDVSFTANTNTQFTTVNGEPLLPNTFTQGTVIEITCQNGYFLAQQSFSEESPDVAADIMCDIGEWVHFPSLAPLSQLPNCYPRYCPDLPIIDHSFVPVQASIAGASRHRFPQRVKYQCLSGFSFRDGKDYLECGSNGQWLTPYPECGQATPCTPFPSDIPDGSVELLTPNTGQPGDTAKFSCDPGFVLNGGIAEPTDDPYRRCSNGVWGSAPTCRKLTCRKPSILNAEPLASTLFEVGVSLDVDCTDGFVRNGPPSVMCLDDQTLTTVPTCDDEDECLSQLKCSQICINTPGTFICACNQGFVLDANGETCIDVEDCIPGSFFPQRPCQETCEDIPLGSFTCSCTFPNFLYTAGGTAGFTNQQNQDGNTYGNYVDDQSCVPQQCLFDHANNPAERVVLKFQTHYNIDDTIELACQVGYQPIEVQTHKCIPGTNDPSGGEWDPPLTTCSVGLCTVPQPFGDQPSYTLINNVGPDTPLSTGDPVNHNDVVEFFCQSNSGSRPFSYSVTRRCIYNYALKTYTLGQDEPYACRVVECPPTASISIGEGLLTFNGPGTANTLAGASYTLSCAIGSTLSGGTIHDNNAIVCVADDNPDTDSDNGLTFRGTWDAGDITCSAGQCPAPLSFYGTTQDDSGNYLAGSMLSYMCNQPGFILQNNRVYTCTASTIPGDRPSWVQNGVVNGQPPQPGDIVCVDNEAPVISGCPAQPITLARNTPVFLANVAGSLVATDNSGGTTWSYGSFINGDVFNPSGPGLGSMTITATARGVHTPVTPIAATATCVITINELDLVNPEFNGASSGLIYIDNNIQLSTNLVVSASTSDDTSITFNPSAIAVTTAGGSVPVTVTATDLSGRSHVVVLDLYWQASCRVAPLPDPVNGVKDCQSDPNTGTEICTFTCNTAGGYEFRVGNGRVESLLYTCSSNGAQWQSLEPSRPNGQTPQCSFSPPGVPVTDIEIWYTGALNTVADSTCIGEYDLVFRNGLGERPPFVPPSGCNGLNVAVDISSLTTSLVPDQRLRVRLDVKIQLTDTGGVFDYAACTSGLLQDIQGINQDFSLVGSILRVQIANCPVLLIDEFLTNFPGNGATRIECPSSTIPYNGACVPCNPGSYYDNTASICLPCPQGSYSSTAGSPCIPCPTGQSTATTGSTSSSSCEDTCETLGTRTQRYGVSNTGVKPCSPCLAGEYPDPDDPSRICKACIDGSTTNAGARSIADCVAACPAGQYSPSGYDFATNPCQLCPRGTYKTQSGPGQCIACPDSSQSTVLEGSSSPGDCSADAVNEICTQAQVDCLGQGTCEIRNGRPVCICNPGFTGSSCQSQINNCYTYSCQGRGVCTSQGDGHVCTCNAGYEPTPSTTDNCEVNTFCDSNTCSGRGECQLRDLESKCVCQQGFGGTTCTASAVPCTDSPCTAGTCNPGGSVRRRCICPPGLSGANCENDIGACSSSPCRNGGTCIDTTAPPYYTCACQVNLFGGTRCEIRLQTCSPSVCNFGGQCIPTPEGIRACSCGGQTIPTGVITGLYASLQCVGTGCEIDPNKQLCGDPSNNPCQQQGFCIGATTLLQFPDQSSCSCPAGYTGRICQTNIDECDSNPCVNGICTDLLNGYTCACYAGYSGDNCEINIDECASCSDEGTQICIDEVAYQTCICFPGYFGRDCEVKLDYCWPDACLHGSSCTPVTSGLTCSTCQQGYTGANCGVLASIGQCTPSYCGNGGTCSDGFIVPFCLCPAGFPGSTCRDDINICNDVPGYCANGAQCTPLATVNSARCDCAMSWVGVRCELEADPCANDATCLNGGTCRPSLNAHTCDCRPGFSGPSCAETPDACELFTCANSGTCKETPYGPMCHCQPGYDGAYCEKVINRNYDIKCDGYDDGRAMAFQQKPSKLDSESFSIGTWVAYSLDDTTGVFLALYSTNEAYVDAQNPTIGNNLVLTLDEAKVTFYKPLGASPTIFHYTRTIGPYEERYKINTGQWFYVLVTCDGMTGEIQVFANNVKVAIGTIANPEKMNYIWLTVGSGYNNIHQQFVDGFKGLISQTMVWSRVLTPADDLLLTTPPLPPHPVAQVTDDIVMDYQGWVFNPGCWRISPTTAGHPIPPAPPEQPRPKFTLCPTQPVSVFGAERRTVVVWDEITFEHSATAMWCRYTSGRAFTWGLYTNVCIIKNSQGYTASCRFDIVVRKLNCPDPLIHSGDLPPNCFIDPVYGGVRICEPKCPGTTLLSVAQPVTYMCTKEGSFNVRNPFTEGRIPACGVESESGVLYNVLISASYPEVLETQCSALSIINGITEEIRVQLQGINDDATYMGPDGNSQNSPLCTQSDCADVIMHVDCPGTHIRIELHYTPTSIKYNGLVYGTAKELLQENMIDRDLFDSQLVVNGKPEPSSIWFQQYPVCRPGAGYLKDSCVVCAPGQSAPQNNEPCRMCPRGSYQDQPGQTNCKPCPAGRVTEHWGATSESECIWECQPGEYFNQDFRKCKPCPIGTYSEEYGTVRCCKPCQAFQTTLHEGSTSESKCVTTCEDGHELAHYDSCVPCARGTYRQQDLQGECVPCPGGFTTLNVGSVYITECILPDCAPGSFINGTECVACPIGMYQPESSQLKCIECGLHKITINVGTVRFEDCVFACPPGSELIEGTKCKPCEIGYYKSSSLPDVSCTKCPSSRITQTTGATSVEKCEVPGCDEGYYLHDNVCRECPVDTYQNEKWQTFCRDCPAGTKTASETGSDSEDDCKRLCPAGQEDKGGICLPCAVGTWKDVSSYSRCRNCTDGKTTARTGATSLAECDREFCTPGEYLRDDLRCYQCERGYYQPEYQQTTCYPCLQGLTTVGVGNEEASDCILFCYSGQGWDFEREYCVLCPQGTYRTQGVEDLCTPCPPGTVTPSEGSHVEQDCSWAACYEGYYLDIGTNVCKACPIGSYQSQKYQIHCEHCPHGTSTQHTGSRNHTDCKRECQPGYETDEHYNCRPCKRGYYRGYNDGLDCLSCPPQSTTLKEGAFSKDMCTLGNCYGGFYQDGLSCKPCPAGTYQPNKWQSSCISCPNYYTTHGTGATSDSNCTVETSCTENCLTYAAGGMCAPTGQSYQCVCRPGWTGHHPNCVPLCNTGYCSVYEDCYTDDNDQPHCRCRPDREVECEAERAGLDLALVVGASTGGLVLFLLLVCIALYFCGCCSHCCRHQNRPFRHYHRHSNKSSPTPSIYSSNFGVTPQQHGLFQQPAMRYAATQHNRHEVYSPMAGNSEPTVIRLQVSGNTVNQLPTLQNTAASSAFQYYEDLPGSGGVQLRESDPYTASLSFN